VLQTVMARLSPAFGAATCETCTVAEVEVQGGTPATVYVYVP